MAKPLLEEHVWFMFFMGMFAALQTGLGVLSNLQTQSTSPAAVPLLLTFSTGQQ